jgi:hypothetical protein
MRTSASLLTEMDELDRTADQYSLNEPLLKKIIQTCKQAIESRQYAKFVRNYEIQDFCEWNKTGYRLVPVLERSNPFSSLKLPKWRLRKATSDDDRVVICGDFNVTFPQFGEIHNIGLLSRDEILGLGLPEIQQLREFGFSVYTGQIPYEILSNCPYGVFIEYKLSSLRGPTEELEREIQTLRETSSSSSSGSSGGISSMFSRIFPFVSSSSSGPFPVSPERPVISPPSSPPHLLRRRTVIRRRGNPLPMSIPMSIPMSSSLPPRSIVNLEDDEDVDILPRRMKLPRSTKVNFYTLTEEHTDVDPISLESLPAGTEVIELECGHILSRESYTGLIESGSNRCPICRHRIEVD